MFIITASLVAVASCPADNRCSILSQFAVTVHVVTAPISIDCAPLCVVWKNTSYCLGLPTHSRE